MIINHNPLIGSVSLCVCGVCEYVIKCELGGATWRDCDIVLLICEVREVFRTFLAGNTTTHIYSGHYFNWYTSNKRSECYIVYLFTLSHLDILFLSLTIDFQRVWTMENLVWAICILSAVVTYKRQLRLFFHWRKIIIMVHWTTWNVENSEWSVLNCQIWVLHVHYLTAL